MSKIRGKNLLFNGAFDIEDPEIVFPMGWLPCNENIGTVLQWSGEKAVYGDHTIIIDNHNYTENMTGIMLEDKYYFDVRQGEEYEISAWMATERRGVPLRLIVVMRKPDYSYLCEEHFKFLSTQEMSRYEGTFTIPAKAALLNVSVGVHDTEETLPSKTWISWVALRKLM